MLLAQVERREEGAASSNTSGRPDQTERAEQRFETDAERRSISR